MPLNCVVQREQGMAALSPLLALAFADFPSDPNAK